MLHERQEAYNHSPRFAGCSRTGPALQELFVACQPNKEVWLADITYVVPTQEEGFLYLAFNLDTYSRRIVGWSMNSHMRTELMVGALEMAVWRRRPVAGLLVHHSDSQNTGGCERAA